MRRLILGLALIAGGLAVADYLGWRADRERILGLAAGSVAAAQLPGLEARLARQTVPARAADLLAWRLLALELDRGWLAELPAAERQAEERRGRERLELAAQLAREVLSRQPAAWRAAAVLGASRYLEASRRGRQEQPVAAWRDPLRAAMRLAPGRIEPALMLASFYLSRWASLAPEERREVPEVLARAFREARGLRLLLPAGVRLAPSLAALVEPIPDRPSAWLELGRQFVALGDLERYADSHRRWVGSLSGDLEERVAAGRARLRGGHRKAGLALLRSVFAAPPDLAHVDSFVAALTAVPGDGEAGPAAADLRAWLDWARDLCAIGRCPFDGETLRRLARAAGDERLPPTLAEPPARTSWPAEEWRRRDAAYRLVLRAATAGDRLRLEMRAAPAAGGALELAWDGRFAGVAVLSPEEPLRWPLVVEPGLHLLQVRHLTGRPIVPSAVSLEPPRPAG